jgi:hypothetical protein
MNPMQARPCTCNHEYAAHFVTFGGQPGCSARLNWVKRPCSCDGYERSERTAASRPR